MSQECDLGQQSVLHAVRTPPRKISNKRKNIASPIEESMSETAALNDSGSKPMNETLMDLSLDESDRQDLSSVIEKVTAGDSFILTINQKYK